MTVRYGNRRGRDPFKPSGLSNWSGFAFGFIPVLNLAAAEHDEYQSRNDVSASRYHEDDAPLVNSVLLKRDKEKLT